MGAWVSLLWRLADLVAEGPIDPVQSTLATLRTAGPLHASLSTPLVRAVALRGELARGTGASDDAHSADEGWLRDVLDRLLAGLRPLMQMRLVSVAEIESVGDDESDHHYALYLHRGPVEHFPIVREKIAASLVKGWCYLLSEDGIRRPLLLSPMVFSGTCTTCGRVEAYLAEGLTFAPLGSKVYARSVTTNHGGAAELPGNIRTREFNAFLEGAILERECVRASPSSDGPTRNYLVPSELLKENNQELTVSLPRETRPPSPSVVTSLLSADQLREVESAATKVGLAGERTALLSLLSVGIASSLPFAPSPIGQLVSDLAHLNGIVVARDGSVPLKQWLVAACSLRGAYMEVATFERAMKSIDEAEPLKDPSKGDKLRSDGERS
jgi:hypothetical protein